MNLKLAAEKFYYSEVIRVAISTKLFKTNVPEGNRKVYSYLEVGNWKLLAGT